MEVRNMIEDNDGRMWVGTMDGLMSFKNNFASVEQIDFETYRGANREIMPIAMCTRFIKTSSLRYGYACLVED